MSFLQRLQTKTLPQKRKLEEVQKVRHKSFPSDPYAVRLLKGKCFLHFASDDRFIDDMGQVHERRPTEKLRLTYFSGGCAYFAVDFWPKLFAARAKDIELNMKFFDNDVCHDGEGIKVFIELDFKSVQTKDTMIGLTQTVRTTVAKFFPAHEDSSCWLLVSDSKLKRGTMVNGCHIVFRSLIINACKGHQLCTSVDAALNAAFGLRGVVDDCYKAEKTFLRPIYAHKMVICHNCEGSDHMRAVCDICQGRGRHGHASVYKPHALLTTEGVETDMDTHLDRDLVATVQSTSIVARAPMTEGYSIPKDEPIYMAPTLRRNKTNHVPGSSVMIKSQQPVTETSTLNAIEAHIRAYHLWYSNVQISTVHRSSTNIFVNVKGVGQNHCGIANRVHSSNRIYFRIHKNRFMEQMCHNDTCKAAKSKTKQHPIDADLRTKLADMVVKKTGPEAHLEFINKI